MSLINYRQDPLSFRSDIQGLRALAVVSVLLFHVNDQLLPGGFLGVDIFFTISGFLITGIVLDKIEKRQFTLVDFAIGRFRRLAPASIATIILSLLVGLFLLPQSILGESGRSGFHALLFVANIDLWLQSGYFDLDSKLKVFLHFWSLSVEEQFYLFWPIVLLIGASLNKRFVLPLVIAALTVFSLLAAEIMIGKYPGAVFYLMPFRVFEFGVGALTALFTFNITNKYVANILGLFGVSLMVVPMVIFDSMTRMPGLLSLIPLSGCVLLLALGKGIASRLLQTPPIVAIGNASYSIYLVHWPILVFYNIGSENSDITILSGSILLVVSIGLGFIFLRLVETPFRYKRFWQTKSLFGFPQLAFSICCVAAIIFSANVWARNSSQSAGNRHDTVNLDFESLRLETWNFAEKNQPEEDIMANILVIGDSHAKGLANALYQVSDASIRFINTTHFCQPLLDQRDVDEIEERELTQNLNRTEACIVKNHEIISSDEFKRADLVIFSAFWKERGVSGLESTLKTVRENTDADVIVFGRGHVFDRRIVDYATKQGAGNYSELPRRVSSQTLSNSISSITSKNGVYYLDREDLQCGQLSCKISDVDGNLFYFDSHHMTVLGSQYLGRRLISCSTPSCERLKSGVKKP